MNKSTKRMLGFSRIIDGGVVLLIAALGLAAAWLIYDLKKEEQTPQPPMQPKTEQVAVYFNNSEMDPDILCYPVFPVVRTVPAGMDKAEFALQSLLAGPTEQERSLGYFTTINENTSLRSIRVEGEIAYADFDRQLGFEVGGSCRVGAIRSSITETVKAVTGAKEVVISIEGNANEILEP